MTDNAPKHQYDETQTPALCYPSSKPCKAEKKQIQNSLPIQNNSNNKPSTVHVPPQKCSHAHVPHQTPTPVIATRQKPAPHPQHPLVQPWFRPISGKQAIGVDIADPLACRRR